MATTAKKMSQIDAKLLNFCVAESPVALMIENVNFYQDFIIRV